MVFPSFFISFFIPWWGTDSAHLKPGILQVGPASCLSWWLPSPPQRRQVPEPALRLVGKTLRHLTNAGINHRWAWLIEQVPAVGKQAAVSPVCWLWRISATSSSSNSDWCVIDILGDSVRSRDDAFSWQNVMLELAFWGNTPVPESSYGAYVNMHTQCRNGIWKNYWFSFHHLLLFSKMAAKWNRL